MSRDLRVVARFEFLRAVRRPQFWAAALSFPILFAVAAGVVSWANTVDPPVGTPVVFEYSDSSGLVSEEAARQLGGRPAAEDAAERARTGQLPAYLAYPADPVSDPVEIIAADRGLFGNGDYETVARNLFADSIDERLDPTTRAHVRSSVDVSLSTFSDGEVAHGLAGMLLPGMLALLLIFIIALIGNQALHCTVEEKENRISEMVLVAIPADVLLRGKLAALGLVALVQITVVVAAGALVLAVSVPALPLEDLGIETLEVDPARLTAGVAILAGGLAMIAGILVFIGAIMPTAKDAASWFSVVVVVVVAPVYLIAAILTNPGSPVVQALTFFPLSAPMAALLRNAAGSLDPWLGMLIAVELLVVGAIVLRFASVAFERRIVDSRRTLLFKN